MPLKNNPLKLNPLQLRTLTLLQAIANIPGGAAPGIFAMACNKIGRAHV